MSAADAARLATRLRRLEVQIRAFGEMHVRELGEVADKLAAIAKLQADELQMVLDELADVEAATDAVAAQPDADASADVTQDGGSDKMDPAAASPKRAKWIAEQERRAHLSRRDLLRGRERP